MPDTDKPKPSATSSPGPSAAEEETAPVSDHDPVTNPDGSPVPEAK